MILMRKFVAIAAVLCLSATSQGQFDLQVTEMWPGNEPGENLTADWFEITNFGDAAWVAAADGDLWFDDDSFDATAADLLMNVDTIGPGESVVFVDGDPDGAPEFVAVWDPVVTLPQVGSYEGSGMGQGGDGVGIWISFGAPMGTPDFTATYPSAVANGGQSYDSVLGEFSTVGNASFAVATVAVNDVGQAAIGSPGRVVPEPAAGVLVLGGLLLLLGRRRS